MKVIKEGEYPEENKMMCQECNCEYLYYNNEIEFDKTVNTATSNIVNCYYVTCPCCKRKNRIKYEFIDLDKEIAKLQSKEERRESKWPLMEKIYDHFMN